MSNVDIEIHKQVEDMDSSAASRTNEWFSLAKNIAWLLGLILVASWKFQSVENVNEAQDKEIKAINIRESVATEELKKLNASITQVLIAVAEMRAQHEAENRMNKNGAK